MKKLLEKNLSILTEENQLNLSEEKSDKKIIEELKGRIEFINVTFYDPIYPSEKILNNISFVIEEGKKICIVGLDNKAKEYIFYLICGLCFHFCLFFYGWCFFGCKGKTFRGE